MARFRFAVGEFFESLTRPELHDALSEHRAAQRAEAAELAKAHGRRYMRVSVTGQAAAGVLQMGGDYPNTGPAGTIVPSPQPRAGYAWAARRISVSGLTTGTTPDIVNLHRSTPGTLYTGGTLSNGIWQFNGNNFAYVFSHEQLIWLEGETPVITSVGTFASTARIVLALEVVEVPEVELYRTR
jgi:hypothetical protein